VCFVVVVVVVLHTGCNFQSNLTVSSTNVGILQLKFVCVPILHLVAVGATV